MVYHVAVNGQATGPYDLDTLKQMAALGNITADSLVWKVGMPNWKKISTIEELKEVVAQIMPPIPPM